MVYRGQLELFFDLAAFLPAAHSSRGASDNAPISLTYVADADAPKSLPLTTQKRFFLQLMRAHLQSIDQHQTNARDLLAFVSESWTKALALSEEIRCLDMEGITHCDILSDERLAVQAMLLVPTAESKVNIFFEVGAAVTGMAMEIRLKARAQVAYGVQYNEDKLRDFVKNRMGENSADGAGSWAHAVRELKKRLIARGKN